MIYSCVFIKNVFYMRSCDRGSGRRPKLKKNAKQSCTIYTELASREFSAPCHSSTTGFPLLKFAVRLDIGSMTL